VDANFKETQLAARPDLVLIAGDLFHSVRPSNPAILFAFQQFQRLREGLPESPVILIAGNHDTPRSTETGWILSLFDTLGVHVVTQEAKRLAFSQLDLAVLAVPHAAQVEGRKDSRPEGKERYQVLITHGEPPGLLPTERGLVEYGGAQLDTAQILDEKWSYVALGHYHVQQAIGPRAWYSGSLEYIAPNPWGQKEEEAQRGVRGKGWLLVDLETGEVTPQLVPAARKVIDLPWLDATQKTAGELDTLIAAQLAAIPGGHKDQVVRQVIRNVPRQVGRELNHAAIRAVQAEALHFQLDLRRPEFRQEAASGSPGRRQTLPELLQEFLGNRPLPAEVDRQAFVRTGVELMQAVDREWLES
jgi:DNA repair exonuclease SbcCD nuclease subunit